MAELSENLKKSEDLRKTDQRHVKLLHENYQLRVRLSSMEAQYEETKRQLALQNTLEVDLRVLKETAKIQHESDTWRLLAETWERKHNEKEQLAAVSDDRNQQDYEGENL